MPRILRHALTALAASMGLSAATAVEAPYELVDLATPFAAFWDETEDRPIPERVAEFKSRFGTLLPGFYTADRERWRAPADYDVAIARALERIPAIRERFTAVTNGFSALLAPAYASFAQAFPDVRPIGPIYVVHSLAEFDGGTREIAGRKRLMFGADVIAKVHDFPDERPFFHHELFHVYHAQYFPECEIVRCAVWAEGLAVLVAERLNPGATDAELLLSSPRPIRPEVDRNRDAAVCAVASRLDATELADATALFAGGDSIEGLPPRVGYYVGYLAAVEAARDRTLAELAHLDHAAARALLGPVFGRLADCQD
jgi:hypothetical protein